MLQGKFYKLALLKAATALKLVADLLVRGLNSLRVSHKRCF